MSDFASGPSSSEAAGRFLDVSEADVSDFGTSFESDFSVFAATVGGTEGPGKSLTFWKRNAQYIAENNKRIREIRPN